MNPPQGPATVHSKHDHATNVPAEATPTSHLYKNPLTRQSPHQNWRRFKLPHVDPPRGVATSVGTGITSASPPIAKVNYLTQMSAGSRGRHSGAVNDGQGRRVRGAGKSTGDARLRNVCSLTSPPTLPAIPLQRDFILSCHILQETT